MQLQPTSSYLCACIILLLSGCSGSANQERIKFTQYFNQGEKLYEKHCSNCHQKDGSGLGLLYPPLKDADYLKDKKAVICLIKYGKTGELIVNGKVYNQAMPGLPTLSNLEIAEITTYIYNAWSSGGDEITDVRDVSAFIDTCTD